MSDLQLQAYLLSRDTLRHIQRNVGRFDAILRRSASDGSAVQAERRHSS